MADEETGPKYPDDQNQPSPPIVGSGEISPSEATEGRGYNNADPSKDRLDRDMVKWTRMVGVFTGLLFFGSMLQFCAMRSQQNIMQGQLDESIAEQRPWLKATPKIVGPLISKGSFVSTTIEIDISNVGHTPASAVRGSAMIINNGRMVVTKDDLQSVCDRATNTIVLDEESGADLVFPGGTDSLRVEGIDELVLGGDNTTPKFSTEAILSKDIALVYCVSYLNAGSEPRRHTGGAFAIGGIKGGMVLKDGEMIDPSELRLERSPFDLKWRSYAD